MKDDLISMEHAPPSVRISANVSQEEAAVIEEFRVTEGLATRAEAVRLLLQIAVDSVTKAGNRFWDKAPEPKA